MTPRERLAAIGALLALAVPWLPAGPLHTPVVYSVLNVGPAGGVPVPVLSVDTTGFDPARLNEADRTSWHVLEDRIDGRYPLLEKRGRARIVGQYLRLARRAGSRYHGEVRFLLPSGEVIFHVVTYGRERGRWQVTDDVTGLTISSTDHYVPAGKDAPDRDTAVVECVDGSRIEVHGAPAAKAKEPLQKALATCWSRLKGGPRARLARALLLMDSLDSRNMDGRSLKALERSQGVFAMPVPDLAAALGLGTPPRLEVSLVVPPPNIADAFQGLPEPIQKRFFGARGWKPLDLAEPFEKVVRSLP